MAANLTRLLDQQWRERSDLMIRKIFESFAQYNAAATKVEMIDGHIHVSIVSPLDVDPHDPTIIYHSCSE
jgi:hypothetical protein